MPNKRNQRGFGTRTLHTEYPYMFPLAHFMPVYLTSSYLTESLENDPDVDSFFYTRKDSPNARILAHMLASLEGGEAATVMADGMRAISATFAELLKKKSPGSIVASRTLYSDTFMHLKEDYGHKMFLPLDPADSAAEQLDSYIKNQGTSVPPIEMVFLETPTNPTLDIYDISYIAHRIHQTSDIPVVVDNTFASPYNQRPLELGADLVIQSLTKYCCGNGTTLGGAVIGRKDLVAKIQNHVKRAGGHLHPFAILLIEIGLQTLSRRMISHNKNGMRLARYLSAHKKIARVYYPGLPSHNGHDIALKQMRTPHGRPGFSGMVSFELSRPEWVKPFADYLAAHSFIGLGVSLGCADSLFCVPARQTHRGLTPEDRALSGITDTLIRMSVGIEDWGNIKSAISRALNQLS